MFIIEARIKNEEMNKKNLPGWTAKFEFNTATKEEAIEKRFAHLKKWNPDTTKEINEKGCVIFTTPKFTEVWEAIHEK